MNCIFFFFSFLLVTSLEAQSSLPPEMIFVEGGTFTMGCTPEQQPDCGVGESPTHIVRIPAFEIGKYEVTQAQWQSIIGYNPANLGYGISPDRPVYLVSYYECITFCNRLSQQNGLKPAYYFDQSYIQPFDSLLGSAVAVIYIDVFFNPDANGYRLPTEAEWEYSARGGNQVIIQTKYSGSNNVDEVAWYHGNNVPYGTKPVGQKLANALQLYDMSGNIIEWTYDWYSPYGGDLTYYSDCNPFFWQYPIRRGGEAFTNTFSYEKPRVASRVQKYVNVPPIAQDPFYGFRLARNAD